jgi:HAD superfamily phosphatase (TIGR01668 family)
MFYRMLYTCFQAWKHRRLLANYAHKNHKQIASIVDIHPQQLLELGIRSLIIDFDGVLAFHGKTEPTEEAKVWLRKCCQYFGPNKIFILSNKPTLARKRYFNEHFLGVNFVVASHKKPFPHSILKIIQITKLQPMEILVIDDRLLTGILAAIISKVRGLLITKPFVDYQHCPYQEKVYVLLRQLEYKIFHL